MPYTIRKETEKFCVYKLDTDEKMGCSDTREKAEAQIRALHAAEEASSLITTLSVDLESFNIEEYDMDMDPGLIGHIMEKGFEPKPGLPPEHVMKMAQVAKKLKKLAKVIFYEHFIPLGGENIDVREYAMVDDEDDFTLQKVEAFNLKNLRSALSSIEEALDISEDDRIKSHLRSASESIKKAIADYDGKSYLPVNMPKPVAANEEYGNETNSELLVEDDSLESLMELLAAGKRKEFEWNGPIVFEGVMTGDNRVFKPGSIEWDNETLPWPFRWQKSSTSGHDGAVPIGRVDKLERREDGSIYGFGVIIPSLNDEAKEYLRLLEAGVASGVSVDGDSAEFDVQDLGNGEHQVVFSSMRLRSLTAVDVPAFNEARVELADPKKEKLAVRVNEDEEKKRDRRKVLASKIEGFDKVEDSDTELQGVETDLQEDEIELQESVTGIKPKRRRGSKVSYSNDNNEPKKNRFDTITAAAIPVKPKLDWFEEPEFDGPTPISIHSDGSVSGHLALFDTCHIGFPGCVTPPKGSSYKYFHTGEVETDDGGIVEVGHLTFHTGHADMRDSAKAAAVHYDNTGTVGADVRAGEDKYGIWITGALRSGLSDEEIREFRAAPLSGDWRRIAGRLELVGALAVNIPGFPVPRARALVASGETESLITFSEDEESRVMRREELAQKLGVSYIDRKRELAQRLGLIELQKIKKQFGKFCVTDDKGLVIKDGCFDTEAEAKDKLDSLNESSGYTVVFQEDEEPMKTEDGKKFPKSDFAYTPSDNVSEWKLRLTSTHGGDPDPRIVGAAVAALGEGFRGQKVKIPTEDLPAVKAKVRVAWIEANPDKDKEDLPDILKG